MNLIPVNRPLITQTDIDAVTNSLNQTWISGDTPPVRQLEDLLCSTLEVADAHRPRPGACWMCPSSNLVRLTHTRCLDKCVPLSHISAIDSC